MSVNYSDKQNGGRFWDLCLVLNMILTTSLPNLIILLKAFIYKEGRVLISESSRTHGLIDRYGEIYYESCLMFKGGKDGRVQLPHYVLDWLRQNPNNPFWRITLDKRGRPSKGSKVTLTWLVCYVSSNLPNPNILGYENFECSHRCLCAGRGKDGSNLVCLVPSHLIWESSSANQSRGYGGCMTLCHCGCGVNICMIYRLHDPPCI